MVENTVARGLKNGEWIVLFDEPISQDAATMKMIMIDELDDFETIEVKRGGQFIMYSKKPSRQVWIPLDHILRECVVDDNQ